MERRFWVAVGEGHGEDRKVREMEDDGDDGACRLVVKLMYIAYRDSNKLIMLQDTRYYRPILITFFPGPVP